VDNQPETQPKLKRSIGLWSAVAINVGAIIGGGIFVVTGIVAGLAGSALVISMIIAGVIAFLTALSFAELTSWKPIEGSVYAYGRELVSPFAGFLSGWMWIISNTFSGAAVSLGFAYYLTAAFPGLPSNLIAAGLCLVFTGLNILGAKESATVNNILVSIKLAILAFFVVFGVFYVNTANYQAFTPISSGVLFGAFYIFFAYGGFARIAVVAEEVKDAKRNVPLALLISLGISMAVYILVGIIAVGLVSAPVLAGSTSPLSTAAGSTGNMLAVEIVSIGGLVATASVLLTSILGVSRMEYSMARGKDLPKTLAHVHAKFGTPIYAIITTGLVMAVLVLFVDLTQVVALSTFSLLFNYIITNIAAYKLNHKDRKYHKIIHLAGLASCILLISLVVFESTDSAVIGVIFLTLGVVYYQTKKRLKKPQV
jgi:basic amino acid/polyamine antiporter, APA family